MIFSEAHNKFKKQEIYSIFKIGSYIFVIIGFLTVLEFFFYFIGSDLRPIGEIYAALSTDIVTETRSNSLMPVVTEGNPKINMFILIVMMGVCFGSFIMFVTYLSCLYKSLKGE